MNCFDFSTPFKRLERKTTALFLNRPYSLKVKKIQDNFWLQTLIWFLRDDPASKMCPGKNGTLQKCQVKKQRRILLDSMTNTSKTLMPRTRWKFIFHLQVVPNVPIRLGKLKPK